MGRPCCLGSLWAPAVLGCFSLSLLRRPVVLALQVYSGGLGSYALLVMVAAFLQLHPSRQQPGEGFAVGTRACPPGLINRGACLTAAQSLHQTCFICCMVLVAQVEARLLALGPWSSPSLKGMTAPRVNCSNLTP